MIEVGGLILNGKSEDIVPLICDGLMCKKEEKKNEKLHEVVNVAKNNSVTNSKLVSSVNIKNPVLGLTGKITNNKTNLS